MSSKLIKTQNTLTLTWVGFFGICFELGKGKITSVWKSLELWQKLNI